VHFGAAAMLWEQDHDGWAVRRASLAGGTGCIEDGAV
jgi:hypothetical protein